MLAFIVVWACVRVCTRQTRTRNESARIRCNVSCRYTNKTLNITFSNNHVRYQCLVTTTQQSNNIFQVNRWCRLVKANGASKCFWILRTAFSKTKKERKYGSTTEHYGKCLRSVAQCNPITADFFFNAKDYTGIYAMSRWIYFKDAIPDADGSIIHFSFLFANQIQK